MAFSIVGTNTATGTGPSLSVTKPTGTASGDAILIFAQTETASTAATSTGFTQVSDKASTLQSMRVTTLQKVAGASEPASYSVTGGTGVSFVELTIIVIRGGASSAFVDVTSNNANTANSTAVTWPSVTTTAIDMLVAFAVNWTGSESFTTPTGFTAQVQNFGSGLYCFTEVQTAAGATGTISSTLSLSDAWITVLVAVLPASGTITSGTVNMGGGPDGLALVAASDIATFGGSGGLATVASVALGMVNLGGAGDLDYGIQVGSGGGALFAWLLGGGPGGVTALSDVLASALLGGGPDGLSASSVALDGATLGGSGGIASAASQALAGAMVGDLGAGLAPFSGIVQRAITMGGSGGLFANGGIFLRIPRLTMGTPNVPGGGLQFTLFSVSVGYPNGHWANLVVWIWRETSPGSGVFGWKACPVAIWRGPGTGWKQLTT